MASGDTAATILSRFTYQQLPRIQGVPDYNSITLVANDLKANAACIASELGGGALGHLALTVPTAVYATLSNTAFIIPVNPGAAPPNIAIASTAAQISANRDKYTDKLNTYRTYNNVQNALKQQLLASVDDIYVRTLRNVHTGYARVTTLQILSHLYQVYGRLTPMAMQENDTRFRQAYNPSEPFELLIQQIEDAQAFAAAGGQAYSAEQIVSNAYNIVHHTGMFIDTCREWRRRAAADKTWANFKDDFAQAHTELGELTHTSQAGGYHQANNVMNTFANEAGEALANLATATAADRDMLRSLQATNAALIQQNTVKDAEIGQLRLQVQQFQAGLSNRTNNNNNNNRNNNNNNHGGRGNGNNTPNNNTPGKKRYPNLNYCWTHGYDIDARHESSNCRNPNPGHQLTATRTNPMGGSEASMNRTPI